MFRRIRFAMLLVAAFVLMLAGCAGSQHSAHAKPRAAAAAIAPQSVSNVVAPGRPCLTSNYYMQCALPHVSRSNAVSPVSRSAPAPGSQYGVDFAWGGPRSCSALKAIGAKFAWSYWSYDTSGKNWTVALINQLHACGIATVGGWETTANRAQQGYSAGVSDAIEAARQARVDGNTNGAITAAVDCDCSGASILAYFQGWHHILGDRGNAYGGYYQILYLSQHGVVGHLNFQTYAWSGGLWLPASIAPLEQYLNGSTYDNDRAIAPNYGQFPAPPPPGPTAAQLYHWVHAGEASIAAYHAAHCTQPVLGPKNCGQFAWRLLHFYGLAQAAQHTHSFCWGKHAQLDTYVCQIARPEVSIWSKARDSSQRALLNLGCNGPAGFPRPVNSPTCNKKRQQARYFDGRIKAALKAY